MSIQEAPQITPTIDAKIEFGPGDRLWEKGGRILNLGGQAFARSTQEAHIIEVLEDPEQDDADVVERGRE